MTAGLDAKARGPRVVASALRWGSRSVGELGGPRAVAPRARHRLSPPHVRDGGCAFPTPGPLQADRGPLSGHRAGPRPLAGNMLILNLVHFEWTSRNSGSVFVSVLQPGNGLVPVLPGPWKGRWR